MLDIVATNRPSVSIGKFLRCPAIGPLLLRFVRQGTKSSMAFPKKQYRDHPFFDGRRNVGLANSP
jgi:hypothetical protein